MENKIVNGKVGAVIFDMDGLLLDTERLYMQLFVSARNSFGLPDDPEVFLTCIGLRDRDTDQILRSSLGGKVTLEKFVTKWMGMVESVLEKDVPLKLGARELVNHLHSNGFLLGIATSAQTLKAQSRLEKCGLLGSVDI